MKKKNTDIQKLKHLAPELAVELEANTLWCRMKSRNFSNKLLISFESLIAWLEKKAATNGVMFNVTTSENAAFNLGGDLALFAKLIQLRDKEALLRYALTCVDLQYRRLMLHTVPVTSIALVEGDAFGGGFESALAHDFIVAGRNARFQFPECYFDLFPGMGAFSLLRLRGYAGLAKSMMISGRTYSAEEMHEIGVVSALVDSGEGEAAVRELISGLSGRGYSAACAHSAMEHMQHPDLLQEMKQIAEFWSQAAYGLDPKSVKFMERLVAKQQNKYPHAA